jgi:GntR family transcriptional regulator/MocR family aminotransferase
MVWLVGPISTLKLDHFRKANLRSRRGVFLPPLPTNRVRRGALYHTLRAAILDGTLSAGERLPSSRQAASDYQVSRGMVEEVFSQLMDEGFLDRKTGRGTFVASQIAALDLKTKISKKHPKNRRASRRGMTLAQNAACREPAHPIPFNAGIADTSLFPWDKWRLLQARATCDLGREGLGFADPRGLPELRAAIARHLAQFRGISREPSEIVVFNSAQQALNALGLLLLEPGQTVWIEDPCYLGARAAFGLANAVIVPIPVDEEGIRVDLGIRRAPRVRLVYTTPSHQYPTGVAMSLERRVALLEWGQAVTPLYSLDPESRVLYIGTLNKSMFVSLRLAYAVVPQQLVEQLANIRTQLDGFTSVSGQKTMSLFMDEGYFSAHLRRMRGVYAEKRSVLMEGLAPLADYGWSWTKSPSGMHLLVRHRKGNLVRRIAKQSSMDLALLTAYRAKQGLDDGLFLRYAALNMSVVKSASAALLETVESLTVN